MDRLRFWMESPQKSFVYWIERRSRSVHLQATPIDVSSVLSQKLLRTGRYGGAHFGDACGRGRLRFCRAATGVAECANADRRQSIRLPETGAALRAAAPAGSTQRGIYGSGVRGDPSPPANSVADGPSCCSRAISRCGSGYDRISFEIDYPTLLQGTAPRSALLEEFRSTPNCSAVRDVIVLAGRRCAGRAVELRDHRQAAVCRSQRSGCGGTDEGAPGRRRRSVLFVTRFRRRRSR